MQGSRWGRYRGILVDSLDFDASDVDPQNLDTDDAVQLDQLCQRLGPGMTAERIAADIRVLQDHAETRQQLADLEGRYDPAEHARLREEADKAADLLSAAKAAAEAAEAAVLDYGRKNPSGSLPLENYRLRLEMLEERNPHLFDADYAGPLPPLRPLPEKRWHWQYNSDWFRVIPSSPPQPRVIKAI